MLILIFNILIFDYLIYLRFQNWVFGLIKITIEPLDRGDRLRVPETELFVDIQPGYIKGYPPAIKQSKEKTPVFPETSVEFRDFPAICDYSKGKQWQNTGSCLAFFVVGWFCLTGDHHPQSESQECRSHDQCKSLWPMITMLCKLPSGKLSRNYGKSPCY